MESGDIVVLGVRDGSDDVAGRRSVDLRDLTECLSSLRLAVMLDSFVWRASSLLEMSDSRCSEDSDNAFSGGGLG